MRFPPTNPWHHADIADRGYITPEDITAARDAGANGEELLRIVLVAIGQGEVEDKAACAYVATEASSPKERAPAQSVRITTEAEADAHFGADTEMAEWAKWYVRKAATLDVRGALISVVPGLKGGGGVVELQGGDP